MRMTLDLRRLSIVLMAALCGWSATPRTGRAEAPPIPWASAGGGLHHTRAVLSPVGRDQLRPATAKQLRLKWSFGTAGDVSATPTVEPGGLYVPDWGGRIHKLDPVSGKVRWSRRVSDYTGDPHSVSRGSPAIAGEAVIFGDLSVARVIAVDKRSGDLLWARSVDGNSDSMVTSSPVVYGDLVYVGVSSREEARVAHPPKSFRGSVVALNLRTGAIVWQKYMVPHGYTGGAVVASPVVDEYRHTLYVASDNNYSIPDRVEECVVRSGTSASRQLDCLDPTDYVDALLALDLKTGDLKWSRRFQGADTWTSTCDTGAGCDQPPGLDFDFAGSPNLFEVSGFNGVRDDRGGRSRSWVLGIGQKSGYYRAINPDNGGMFWATLVGRGGIQWGSAIDLDDRHFIYTAVNNNLHRVNTLRAFDGDTQAWDAGSWAKIDARTGKLVWHVPAHGRDLRDPSYGAAAPAPLAFTNYVVFAGASSGYMTALDAITGRVLWAFQSHGSVEGGPAIFDDWVYWGTGYARRGVGYHRLYAFSVR